MRTRLKEWAYHRSRSQCLEACGGTQSGLTPSTPLSGFGSQQEPEIYLKFFSWGNSGRVSFESRPLTKRTGLKIEDVPLIQTWSYLTGGLLEFSPIYLHCSFFSSSCWIVTPPPDSELGWFLALRHREGYLQSNTVSRDGVNLLLWLKVCQDFSGACMYSS